MAEIVYQNKDVASKVVGEALLGRSLAVFGLPDLKIVSLLPTNLPAVESNELRLDNLFLLNDGSVAIIDYESDCSRENFIKYLNYIARVMKRYAEQHRLKELKKLKVVIIYTADVIKAESVYDLGGLTLKIEPVYLLGFRTEEIFNRLEEKITAGQRLDEDELIQIMILPLTVKGKRRKQKVIIQAVKLAKRLPDRRQSIRVLAGILTFSDKVIDEAHRRRIKEEMRMTQIERMIFEEACEIVEKDATERGMKKGMQQGLQQGLQQGMQQGLQQGLQQGIQQGLQQGLQQGMQQGLEQGKINAQKLTSFNLAKSTTMTISEIAKAVEASAETVKTWFIESGIELRR